MLNGVTAAGRISFILESFKTLNVGIQIFSPCSTVLLSLAAMDAPTPVVPTSHSFGTSLPPEIKLHVARELYCDCVSPGDPGHTQDLIALSLSEKSWRAAVLPCEYAVSDHLLLAGGCLP